MKKTIENKVSDTILEKPIEIKIGDETYKVAPPCTATLIEVSSEITKLPHYEVDKNADNVFPETLRIAKDCKAIGSILATLILGAEHLTEVVKKPKKKIFWVTYQWEDEVIDKRAALADTILKKLRPSETNTLISKILVEQMEIGDFFGFTTSLIEINLTKPTKAETGK